MQNINPPVQTHQPSGQIILPPAVETLEPTLTDDSSMDQIMASVFGDYSPQGNPPAHTQEPQMLDTVPSLFDESNDLISFLDHFETGLAIEQQEAPMDFTMPRMKNLLDQCRHRTTIVFGNLGRWPDRVAYYEQDYPYTIIFEPNFGVHIPRSFGKNGDCVYESFESDLGQRGRVAILSSGSSSLSPSLRGTSTSNYGCVHFADCTRVADVYVKWLTWLDDWEMHRDDNVPWRMVSLQPWKRALKKHVQRSHEKALANGMPSDVTLLEHI
ncbi:uncharacterized protein TNCV_2075751 [Trichonephila clavipes]|nr:uncharacterized protein TNCV_2075751 [Trichonephila clavipes]